MTVRVSWIGVIPPPSNSGCKGTFDIFITWFRFHSWFLHQTSERLYTIQSSLTEESCRALVNSQATGKAFDAGGIDSLDVRVAGSLQRLLPSLLYCLATSVRKYTWVRSWSFRNPFLSHDWMCHGGNKRFIDFSHSSEPASVIPNPTVSVMPPSSFLGGHASPSW